MGELTSYLADRYAYYQWLTSHEIWRGMLLFHTGFNARIARIYLATYRQLIWHDNPEFVCRRAGSTRIYRADRCSPVDGHETWQVSVGYERVAGFQPYCEIQARPRKP